MKILKLSLLTASVTGAACFTTNLHHATARATIGISSSRPLISGSYRVFSTQSNPKQQPKASTTSTFLDEPFEQDAEKSKNLSFPVVLWRFTRPHTVIGSALAIPALHFLAAPSFQAAFTSANAAAMVFAMVPSLLMNLYITGLNQITDVEIDRINKPNLPLVTGELSTKAAQVTVLVSLILSLALGMAHPVLGSQGLNVALWGSGILGTLYSLPPVRLKRFPLLAAFCIVAVRGTIINAGFFAHAKAAAYGVSGATVSSCLLGDLKCGLSSLFFAVFGIVIALLKDVPDVKGDEIAKVRTFAVRVGQKRIFGATKSLLMALFATVGAGFLRGAVQAPSAALAGCRGIVSVASILAVFSVRKEGEKVDPEEPKQVYNFYMHLWKLFYLSYLALPFVR